MSLIPNKPKVISSKPNPPNPLKAKPFSKLGSRERRVAIARDVLTQMKSGSLVPTSGMYCVVKDGEGGQPDVLKNVKQCEVCGIGSLFVATMLRIKPKAPVMWMDGYLEIDGGCYATDIHRSLARYFTYSQLRLIEGAFEASHCCGAGVGNTTADRFFTGGDVNDVIKDDFTRLRLIMENIIVNGGEFIDDPNHPNHYYTFGRGYKTPNFSGATT